VSIVAIGATETVDPLRLLGFEVIKVSKKPNAEEVESIVAKILENRVALLEGEIYSAVRERLNQVTSIMKEPPLVVVIPSSDKASTNRLEELYSRLSLAVGVRLKWVTKG